VRTKDEDRMARICYSFLPFRHIYVSLCFMDKEHRLNGPFKWRRSAVGPNFRLGATSASADSLLERHHRHRATDMSWVRCRK